MQGHTREKMPALLYLQLIAQRDDIPLVSYTCVRAHILTCSTLTTTVASLPPPSLHTHVLTLPPPSPTSLPCFPLALVLTLSPPRPRPYPVSSIGVPRRQKLRSPDGVGQDRVLHGAPTAAAFLLSAFAVCSNSFSQIGLSNRVTWMT